MFWKMRRIKAYRFCKNETAKKNLFRQFLRIPQLWQFYGYKSYITTVFRLWIAYDEYTKNQAIENFKLRACIESLMAVEKFGISGRKV